MARLIAPIFCWHGKAYQTTSYFNYRPLGDVSGLLEIFDRHFVDEIFLSCRTDGCGPDFGVLSQLKQSKMATPVCYAGGINCEQDVVRALEAGADRVGINSILFRREQAEKVIGQIGVQGVIAVLPFRIEGGRVEVFDSATRAFRHLDAELISWLRAVEVEVLLHDVVADGLRLPFKRTVIDSFHHLDIILTGGVRYLDIDGDLTRVKGLGFENILTWSEHAALRIRAETPLLNKRGLV